VNESFAVLTARRSPSLRSDMPLSRSVTNVLFTIRHLLFAIRSLTEVTRRCPEMLPLAFRHSLFSTAP
jgi:hypothetical protein